MGSMYGIYANGMEWDGMGWDGYSILFPKLSS